MNSIAQAQITEIPFSPFRIATQKWSPLYINGRWCEASEHGTFVDLEVSTREPFARAADGTVADMDDAIAAAAASQPAWEALLPSVRAALFYKAAALIEEHQGYFVEALIKETGSTRGKAIWECALTVTALQEAASLTSRPLGESYPSTIEGKINHIVRSAAGVVGVISPWNSPLYLSARGFIYAVALGNTAVVKPSEESPITGGALLAELFEVAGFPPGVLNIVSCSREHAAAIGDKMINDPRIARISFTGSTAVGRKIGEACAAILKRVILEMGGKNPVIVLADADLDYAVNCAFFSAFLHQGQICMSCDKIIVADSLYDQFVAKLVAKVKQFNPMDPTEEASVIGPIINDRQLARMHGLVQSAKTEGANVLIGGDKQGAFYQPTVLTDVTSQMKIYHEEVFGPVTMVFRASDENDAIRIANDTDYGLSAAILTRDATRAQELAKRVQAGMVHINDSCVHDEPHCPFGGMKHSGWIGKWGSAGAIEAFTEQRWISVQKSARQYPF